MVQDAVTPGGYSELLACIVNRGEPIIFISRWEPEQAFLEMLQNRIIITGEKKLVTFTKQLEFALSCELTDYFVIDGLDSEVEIPH